MRLALSLLILCCSCGNHGGTHNADGGPTSDAGPLVGAGIPTMCGSAAGFGLPSWPTPITTFGPEAIADLDGDGKLDVVTSGGSTVSVLRGRGDGTFDCRVDHAVSSTAAAVAIAVGDLNRDGHPDIVTAHQYDSSAVILLGTGTGDLTAPTDVVLPAPPTSIALGDLDGDGAADAAMATLSGVVVMHSRGDGSFDAPTMIDVGGQATAVVLADLDATPGLDLAVTYSTTVGTGSGSSVQAVVGVLSGHGDGTFASSTRIIADGGPPLVAADVNGDSRTDLVIQGRTGPEVWTQSPSGFARTGTAAFGNPFVAGDVDHDGHDDVIAFDADGAHVSFGRADGSLTPGATLAVGAAEAASLGDVDGDGRLDLLFTAGGKFLQVLQGGGDGTFVAPATLPTATSGVALADLNEDGNLDLLATLGGSMLGVFLGDGHGGFGARADTSLAVDSSTVSVGDLDGDGHLDVVVANPFLSGPSSIQVLRGRGDGTFADGGEFPIGGRADSPVLVDFNGDSHLDVVLIASQADVDVVLGNGDCTFQAARETSLGTFATSLAVADLDGDGHLDLVLNGGLAGGHVLLGNGDGTFGVLQDVDFGGNFATAVVRAGDVTGDGKVDIVAVFEAVAVVPGNGDGTFGAAKIYENADGGALAITDLDGDGKPDVVTGGIGFVRGLGAGGFALTAAYETSSYVRSMAIGDLDHDGKLDVVTSGPSIAVHLQRTLP